MGVADRIQNYFVGLVRLFVCVSVSAGLQVVSEEITYRDAHVRITHSKANAAVISAK
jgi:hypothetical protein